MYEAVIGEFEMNKLPLANSQLQKAAIGKTSPVGYVVEKGCVARSGSKMVEWCRRWSRDARGLEACDRRFAGE